MASSLPLQIALLTMAVSFWMIVSIIMLGRRERAQVARSLAALQRTGKATPDIAASSTLGRLLPVVTTGLSGVGAHLVPESRLAGMRRSLDLAGNPAGQGVDQLVGGKVLGLVLCAGAALVLWPRGGVVLVMLAAGAAGFFIPDLLLTNAGEKRQLVIQRTLPDALDLLTISVEAGLGFDAALSQVARASDGPLAGEVFRVLQEMQIGKTRSEAFRALSERTDVADLDRFVNAMVQADRLGIPIAAVLKEQAGEMRLRRSQRAEEQAHKVPVKILFPMIVFLLPSIFVIILGPGVITLSRTL